MPPTPQSALQSSASSAGGGDGDGAGSGGGASPPPKSVRFLRFRQFTNVFPDLRPGAEPPGRLADPRTVQADQMLVTINGKSAEYFSTNVVLDA